MGKGETTRDAILSRAVRLASERGLDDITLSDLARDLGMSKSGVYGHFQSTEALRADVLRTAVAWFGQQVIQPALDIPEGEARIRALFDNWLAWSGSDDLPGGCPFVGATNEFENRPGPERDIIEGSQRVWVEVIAAAVRDSLRSDDFDAGADAEHFAFDVFGIYLAHHTYRQLFNERRAKAWAQESFDRLIDGIRAEPRR